LFFIGAFSSFPLQLLAPKAFFLMQLQELTLVALQLQEKIAFLPAGFSLQSGLNSKQN